MSSVSAPFFRACVCVWSYATGMLYLGHIQQGYLPTSFDRSLAVKMSVKSTKYIFDLLAQVNTDKVHLTCPSSAVIIGLQDQKGYVFNTLESVYPDADFQ